MAKTAAAATSDTEKKPAQLLPPVASGIDDNGLRWEEVPVFGTTYRVREITVAEGDQAYDASEIKDNRGDTTGKYNPRSDSRLRLCFSIVSPPTAPDDIDRWSGTKLAALLFIYDRINSLPAADSEGNA